MTTHDQPTEERSDSMSTPSAAPEGSRAGVGDVVVPEFWYSDHSNLASLAGWMAAEGRSAHEVALMVEKPWNHDADYALFLTDWEMDNR